MKISILLPYKENYSPSYAGAVSLFINETNKFSKFNKNTTIFGYTNYADKFNDKYTNIETSKKFFSSLNKEYVKNFIKLEEIGFSRFGTSSNNKSLFEKPRTDPLDSKTMKPRKELKDKTKFKQAKYVMITGDKSFSPQNNKDFKEIIRLENKNGENIKVVIISRAGSEGLDFKNIRQIHIIDPWYNMNRIEQIIGRGVRTCSHSSLPFKYRNVCIYLHGILLDNDKEILNKVNKPITILHPGPINRGVEITSEIADSEHSIILNQVENGVAVRMAIIYLLAGSVNRS